MHVVVATTVHHPSDARISARQIPALLAAGHDVTYVAPFRARGVEPPDGVVPVDVPRSWGWHRMTALRAARRRLHELGAGADLVLIHDPELLLVAVGGGSRAPIVWDVHEDTAASLTDRPWIPRPLTGGLSRLARRAEAWADEHLDVILAEDRYQSRFRGTHPVIHNYPWVPADPPSPGPGRAVYVGRLAPSRGLDDLLELGQLLRGDGVTVELIGPPDEQHVGSVAAAHARGDVHAPGCHVPNEEALARVRGATVGLNLVQDHPNHRVSLQTKLLEYLANGIPVITTPLPAARELVERHDCGVIVPFGDVEAAADAVRELDHDEAGRIAMAARGRAAVLEHHNWATEARRFVTTLEGWAR